MMIIIMIMIMIIIIIPITIIIIKLARRDEMPNGCQDGGTDLQPKGGGC